MTTDEKFTEIILTEIANEMADVCVEMAAQIVASCEGEDEKMVAIVSRLLAALLLSDMKGA